MKKGVIHIYTGEGKGKTTASVGLALRARSRGLRVLFVQFMKTGANGGELDLLEDVGITVKRYYEIKSPHFYPDMDIRKMNSYALGALQEVKGMLESYDMVVLDEFNNLVRTRIIDEKDALSFMDDIPEGTDLVLTGRGATKGMLDLADYVTYMKAVKHPLQRGLNARKGIEY